MQTSDVEPTIGEAAFHSIFSKLEKSRYLFDIRKVFEFASNKECELLTPQQEVENAVDVSQELSRAMGSSCILSAEKWICTYLSQFDSLALVEEYLAGIAVGALATNGFPSIDYGGKDNLAFAPSLA